MALSSARSIRRGPLIARDMETFHLSKTSGVSQRASSTREVVRAWGVFAASAAAGLAPDVTTAAW